MKKSTFEEKSLAEWQYEATKIMFRLKDEYETFNADDFYELARAVCMPADLIKKFSGSFFRKYQAAGYIKKTGQFTLSKRNGSSPLPVWAANQKDNC